MKTAEMMHATHKRHALAERKDQQVDSLFLWKQSGRMGMIAVEEMATGHLFNTLKMIWNNSAPSALHIEPVRLYAFDRSFYTVDYMTRAVKAMAAELMTRKLDNYQLTCINRIALYTQQPRLALSQ